MTNNLVSVSNPTAPVIMVYNRIQRQFFCMNPACALTARPLCSPLAAPA